MATLIGSSLLRVVSLEATWPPTRRWARS